MYCAKDGFFIRNQQKKYSVGENSCMKVDADVGIVIYIAAGQPQNVPEGNWLSINWSDYDIDINMCLYAPDLERFQKWTVTKAERTN